MKKLGFPLNVEDGWPPYEVEHLWTEQTGKFHRIKNFPFFLDGVAYDDLISAEIGEDNYVQRWNLVEASGNSVIWILDNNKTEISNRLEDIGCDVEIEQHYGLISANVPSGTNVQELNNILNEYEDSGLISVAIPVDRIGLLD